MTTDASTEFCEKLLANIQRNGMASWEFREADLRYLKSSNGIEVGVSVDYGDSRIHLKAFGIVLYHRALHETLYQECKNRVAAEFEKTKIRNQEILRQLTASLDAGPGPTCVDLDPYSDITKDQDKALFFKRYCDEIGMTPGHVNFRLQYLTNHGWFRGWSDAVECAAVAKAGRESGERHRIILRPKTP